MRKRLVSIAQRSRPVHGIGRVLDTLVPGSGRICTVLTFHRLETHEPDLYPGLAGLDAAGFERFMDEIANRFVPIGVDRLIAALSGGTELPERSLVVTFDDGYRDFAEVAWPIMRDRSVPAVLFVPTAHADDPGRRFWWDELYAAIAASDPADWSQVGMTGTTPAEAFKSVRDRIKSQPHDEATGTVRQMLDELHEPSTTAGGSVAPRVLGWTELEQLASDGVALAPHSRTHPMLDRLDPDRLDAEIRGSLDDMLDRLGPGRVERVFAYPSGGHDPRVRAAVERAGFTAAFTTERGLVDVRSVDRFRVPRLNVGREATVGAMRTEVAVRRVASLGRGATRVRPS